MHKNLRPPSLPKSLLEGQLAASHGITGSWQELSGERDQNFKVSAADGARYVFKLCNPDEGDAIIDCQAATLEHIARVDPSLPVPRLQRAKSGEAAARLTHEGQSYRTMLLTWLPGDVLGDAALPKERITETGRMVARLGVALRGFIHGGPATRRLVWDTQYAADLAGQISHLPPASQPLAQGILEHHRAITVPRLAKLRSQIIHGDVHPFNALAVDGGPITGIIDFGDIVHAPLVQDIANALADFINPGLDNAAIIFDFIRGYTSLTRIDEDEADVILDMIEVRLLMTALIEALRHASGVMPWDHGEQFNRRCVPLFAELQGTRRAEFQAVIRRAASFPPKQNFRQPTDDIISRRRRAMGDKLYVFYDPPLHIVRGEGVWLHDSTGRAFLDCYNNVPTVGHCHPYVTEAIVRQARTLNTNTRYITDQSVGYAERLTALCDASLSAVVFVNSGSEANDLAWRMAKAWTGKRGGLAMDFAYHGISEAIDAFSPSNSPENWHAPHIRLLPPPDDYRGTWRRGEPDLVLNYAGLADPLIADLDANGLGVAAFIVDSAFMSNGILDVAPGYLLSIVTKVHAAGGLFIADEVQSGFGRMGSDFWGHRHHGVVPDFVTIGKPAGNGHPLGAVITRPEILAHFLKSGPFFSTFGGNNVACAAGTAVLDVIRDEGLVANACETGAYFRAALKSLMQRHAIIGDVRGVGLAIGVELVRDSTSLEPADRELPRLLNLIRDEGVLMGGEGKLGNILKIRPPIVFQRQHADIAIAAVGRALAKL